TLERKLPWFHSVRIRSLGGEQSCREPVGQPKTPALALLPNKRLLIVGRIDTPRKQSVVGELRREGHRVGGTPSEALDQSVCRILQLVQTREVGDDLVRSKQPVDILAHFEMMRTRCDNGIDRRLESLAHELALRTYVQFVGQFGT